MGLLIGRRRVLAMSFQERGERRMMDAFCYCINQYNTIWYMRVSRRAPWSWEASHERGEFFCHRCHARYRLSGSAVVSIVLRL